MEQIYDMIIIGGGPAGYTAALYAARSGLSVLVLEKLSAGGQMALTEQIDNYPGFEGGIDGFTLGEKMQQSAERFGAVTELAEVYKASLSGRIKTLDTSEGVFQGRTVVIATGASPRPLGVPGEEALVGKGVHYCAAHHRHGLAPIGRAVAGGAVVNALSNKRFLAGNAQRARRRAGGDDHRAALKNALAGLQRFDFAGKSYPVDLRQLRHRAEALGALLHLFAQRKAVDAVLKARIVIDLFRQRHLPAGGELFQHQYRKPASSGVQGGGVSGGAAADDDHVMDLLHSHALTAPAFPG